MHRSEKKDAWAEWIVENALVEFSMDHLKSMGNIVVKQEGEFKEQQQVLMFKILSNPKVFENTVI